MSCYLESYGIDFIEEIEFVWKAMELTSLKKLNSNP